MAKRFVYNLEFPDYCDQLSIGDYIFERIENYHGALQALQQRVNIAAEFEIKSCTGSHAITASVRKKTPGRPRNSVLISKSKASELDDILHLLSIFTRRKVFLSLPNNDESTIIADPRMADFGVTLHCSIPQNIEIVNKDSKSPTNFMEDKDWIHYDKGFEEGINTILELINDSTWKKKYRNGFYLLICEEMIARNSLSLERLYYSNFLHAWTIWENIYACRNQDQADKDVFNTKGKDKVKFVLRKYFSFIAIDDEKVKDLVQCRNRLSHFGEKSVNAKHKDLITFIHATEYLVAKTLNLKPSNVFNVEENFKQLVGS
ncbi:hypothetical protein H6764_00350 [Candidatus Nomurabacteria bacterium]|nr:hypothetical protein [Candidatus Nomurabacteria bacterium]